MRGKPISQNEIKRIKYLRERGWSLPEIIKVTKRGSSTVFKYAKDVSVLAKYRNTLKEK